jgi:hypothetical protein
VTREYIGIFAVRSRRIDLSGNVFGHLTVLSLFGKAKGGQVMWRCRCDCGSLTVVASYDLRRGATISCGCVRRARLANQVTHGETRARRTAEYRAWLAMRARCMYASQRGYSNYGGRGIRVSERWQKFDSFLADLLATIGRRPSPKHSIDRIDVNGNYEPGNIRWATTYEQARNKRGALNEQQNVCG